MRFNLPFAKPKPPKGRPMPGSINDKFQGVLGAQFGHPGYTSTSTAAQNNTSREEFDAAMKALEHMRWLAEERKMRADTADNMERAQRVIDYDVEGEYPPTTFLKPHEISETFRRTAGFPGPIIDAFKAIANRVDDGEFLVLKSDVSPPTLTAAVVAASTVAGNFFLPDILSAGSLEIEQVALPDQVKGQRGPWAKIRISGGDYDGELDIQVHLPGVRPDMTAEEAYRHMMNGATNSSAMRLNHAFTAIYKTSSGKVFDLDGNLHNIRHDPAGYLFVKPGSKYTIIEDEAGKLSQQAYTHQWVPNPTHYYGGYSDASMQSSAGYAACGIRRV